MAESVRSPEDTVKQNFRPKIRPRTKHFESTTRARYSDMVRALPMTAAQKQQQFRVALCFALVYALVHHLAIKIAVEHIPAAMMGATRFLISGPLMLALCAMTGRNIKISKHDFVRVAVIGILLLTGGNVLLAWSEKFVLQRNRRP